MIDFLISQRFALSYLKFIYIHVSNISFQSLWFLSRFPWYRVATSREATEPMVPSKTVYIAIMTCLTVIDICVKLTTDMFILSQFMPFHSVCNKSNTMGATSKGHRKYLPFRTTYVHSLTLFYCLIVNCVHSFL